MEFDNVFIVSNFEQNSKQAIFDSNGKQLTDFVYTCILGGSEEGFFTTPKGDKW